MSTSNFQWRHDGLRWRIKLMQNTPITSLFYCRARCGHEWYINGINQKIDSVEKVIEFLRTETENMRVTTVGNSSGGYMATLVAQKLNAKMAYCVSGQFDIADQISRQPVVRKAAEEGELSYEEQTYQLGQGDCVFIDCRKAYSHSTSDNLWSLQWCHFYAPSLPAVYEKYKERGGRPVFHPDDMGDANYFSRMFRKVEGISPREYRKQW